VASSSEHVRTGEHGSLIVYADKIRKTEENESGEAIERDFPS
jgi:antirestriction protein ArdC